MKHLLNLAAVSLALVSCFLFADEASTPYGQTKVDARLNLTVRQDADIVHFVRDNIDPDVVTKIYELKHADLYELRAYLLSLVQSRKVNESNTGIQMIQFNDGTKMIMVSAENYRFDDTANGQGIDQIIKLLDTPGITSISGKPLYIYLPKYRAASELREMLENAGADMADDETENIGGADRIRCDPSLNLMVLRTANFSRKNIDDLLKEYDCAYPEIKAKITIYELYAENDAKMGLDFQAWKNNDGIDLFNGGARFSQNYTPDGSSLSKGAGWSDVKYLNFNPKWNTKYVDFLVSKGKARVMHTSEVSIRNNCTASIDRTTQVFYAKAEPIESSEYVIGYIYLPDTAFSSTPEAEKTVVTASTSNGESVRIVMNGSTATLNILQLAKDPAVANYYNMKIENGSFSVGGRDAGNSIDVSSVSVVSYTQSENGKLTAATVEFKNDNIAAQKGNRINTEASNEFGFSMTLTPSISEKATILNVRISNSSLIGYESNGNPRIQKSAEVTSKFMISNSGTRLMIGGVEKRDVVRVSGGLPVFKDLPILGWLFSTESESTKRSQLLVVAEVIPLKPQSGLAEDENKTIHENEKELKKAGSSNTWGYRQYLIDQKRHE